MVTQFCYVVSIKAAPSWLALGRSERDGCWNTVREVCREFSDQVSFQYYDSDAFHAHMSDMIICETTDPLAYHHLWDRIKDTTIFTNAYYSITDVRSGIKGVSHG